MWNFLEDFLHTHFFTHVFLFTVRETRGAVRGDRWGASGQGRALHQSPRKTYPTVSGAGALGRMRVPDS